LATTATIEGKASGQQTCALQNSPPGSCMRAGH